MPSVQYVAFSCHLGILVVIFCFVVIVLFIALGVIPCLLVWSFIATVVCFMYVVPLSVGPFFREWLFVGIVCFCCPFLFIATSRSQCSRVLQFVATFVCVVYVVQCAYFNYYFAHGLVYCTERKTIPSGMAVPSNCCTCHVRSSVELKAVLSGMAVDRNCLFCFPFV